MCWELLRAMWCVQSQQDVEEMDDEEDVNKFAHHWSDEEFEANYTEQGYEADTETNMLEDWHKGDVYLPTEAEVGAKEIQFLTCLFRQLLNADGIC